jgi:general secretion pathway protein K
MKLRRKTRAAAALLLSLWALFLLSAMVLSWALDVDSRITLSGNASRAIEAEAMAASGSEIALHPEVKPGAAVLHGNLGRRESFDARITGEGGRINLNWIVAGENPQRLELLRKYLEAKGVDLNERDRMIDCLLDWVDADDLVRLNGAEKDDHYQPANALLSRIEDLKKIKGWEAWTARPDWDADFTLYSTGPLDVVWASREVLLSLPGMTDAIVDRFLELRRGKDGIESTEDDPEFKTAEDVRVAFGFSAEQFKQLASLIGFKDQILRVISEGHSGDVTRVVQMIIRKTGSTPQIIRWKEL